MDSSFRYHGLVGEMPEDVRRDVEALIRYDLDGSEIITIGPQDIEVEFPLPPLIAERFNKHCIARPKGCRDAHVYGLRSRGQYFYIGSTVKSLNGRLRGHICAARRGTNGNRRLARQLLQGEVEIALIDTVAENRRFEREYEVIREYLAKGIKLLNTQLAHKLRSGRAYST